eukprot:6482634-Amphidinium_carterae.1
MGNMSFGSVVEWARCSDAGGESHTNLSKRCALASLPMTSCWGAKPLLNNQNYRVFFCAEGYPVSSTLALIPSALVAAFWLGSCGSQALQWQQVEKLM